MKYAKENVSSEKIESKVVELGTKAEDIKEKGCKLDLEKVNLNKVGKYTYAATCNKNNYTGTIEIVDTTKPKLELKTLNLKTNEIFNVNDFVLASYDLSKIEIKFEEENISNVAGENGIYILPIIATDQSGNTTKKYGILIVTNVVADKFLVASKVESTTYDATLKVSDKIGFNSFDYYINAYRIFDYVFNSKEDYLKAKEDFKNIDGKIIFEDDTLNIKVVNLLTKQDLDVLNGSFPSTYNEISKLYFGLDYTNKIE